MTTTDARKRLEEKQSADKGKGAYVAFVTEADPTRMVDDGLTLARKDTGEVVTAFEEAVQGAEAIVRSGRGPVSIEVVELAVVRRAVVRQAVEVLVQ